MYILILNLIFYRGHDIVTFERVLRPDSPKLTVKTVDCYIRCIGLYGVETWVLLKIDHKFLESFKSGAREGRRTPVKSIV
jgi:hypothetical protein